MILLVALRSGAFRVAEAQEVTKLCESGQYRLATAQEQQDYARQQRLAHFIRE